MSPTSGARSLPPVAAPVAAPVTPAAPAGGRRDTALLLAATAGFAVAVFVLGPYGLKIASKVMVFWLIAAGLAFLIRQAGIVSFGHAGFVATGAYAAGVMSMLWDAPLPLVLLGGGLAVALLSALVGAAVLRTHGLYQLMATLACSQMLFYFFQSLRPLGGDDGFAVTVRPPLLGAGTHWFESDRAWALVILLAAACGAWLLARLAASEFGVQLAAARDDETRLQSLGGRSARVQLAAFVISGLAAGTGGMLWAHEARFVSPQLGSWLFGGELIIMVLLGARLGVLGPLAGAAAIVFAQEIVSQWTDRWPLALAGVILAVVLWPRRGGAAHG
jgi:branched-chain amino acid transport system permease protein